MPLTPFHLGPGIFIGLLFLCCIDLPTFLVASVIVDVEPILVIVLGLNYPLHGFLHTFLGGTIVAFVLAAVMSRVRGLFSPLLVFFRVEQKVSFSRIMAAALSGIYIHILLDSTMHRDIQPFYPVSFNPLLGQRFPVGLDVNMFCFWCFVGVAIVYAARLLFALKASKVPRE